MTAIMMASMGAAAVTTPVLDTTVTVAEALWFSNGTDGDYYVWGYNDAASDPLGTPTMGSIADGTYVDGSLTTRTITSVLYSEDTNGVEPIEEDSIWFILNGSGVPDTDATFREIVYNGVTYARADAFDYGTYATTVTFWQWNNVFPDGPNSGVRTFQVIL